MEARLPELETKCSHYLDRSALVNCASSSGASMSLNKSDSTLIEGERRGDSTEMGDEGIEVIILGPASMLGWVFVGLGVSLNSKEGKLLWLPGRRGHRFARS